MDDGVGIIGLAVVLGIVALVVMIIVYVIVPAALITLLIGILIGIFFAVKNYFASLNEVYNPYGKKGIMTARAIKAVVIVLLLAFVALMIYFYALPYFFPEKFSSYAPSSNTAPASAVEQIVIEELRVDTDLDGTAEEHGFVEIFPTEVGSTSSLLADVITYVPENAFDNNSETCWAEGVDGNGIGEQIVVRFDSNMAVAGISIRNGIQFSSGQYFEANNRVAQLEIALGLEGTPVERISISLEDTMEEQIFRFSGKITVDTIVFTVAKVYSGSAYADTGISDIRILSQ